MLKTTYQVTEHLYACSEELYWNARFYRQKPKFIAFNRTSVPHLLNDCKTNQMFDIILIHITSCYVLNYDMTRKPISGVCQCCIVIKYSTLLFNMFRK